MNGISVLIKGTPQESQLLPCEKDTVCVDRLMWISQAPQL